MKKMLFWVLPLMMSSVCHAEDITIHYNGSKAKVTQTIKDSVKVTVKGANVNLVFEPAWDQSMMSEEARVELGFD